MSKSNYNNRPQSGQHVGAVSSTTEIGVAVAHKKMRVSNLSVMDITAVAASGTNYVSAQALVDGVLVGSAVDTQAGLLAREPLDLDLGTDPLEVEAGSVLTVALTVAAAGALTNASLHSDLEVLGQ